MLELYKRGLKNAEQIQVRHNHVRSKMLPSHFDGFTLLHISDLHVDISEGATRRLNEILPGMTYDICILTGDYRGATPFDHSAKPSDGTSIGKSLHEESALRREVEAAGYKLVAEGDFWHHPEDARDFSIQPPSCKAVGRVRAQIALEFRNARASL